LLGVKQGLLSLHFLYQFFDPIERKLVGYRRGYPLVMLDLSVEFQAFVTHVQFRICAYLPIIQPEHRPFVQIRQQAIRRFKTGPLCWEQTMLGLFGSARPDA
jgi:hypothetical protein